MSFVDTDDVIELNERLLAHVLAVCGVEVELPMRRLPYDEAIDRYGSDKPDLRFGLELHGLTEVFRGSEFNAFRQAIEGGSPVRRAQCRQAGDVTRSTSTGWWAR